MNVTKVEGRFTLDLCDITCHKPFLYVVLRCERQLKLIWDNYLGAVLNMILLEALFRVSTIMSVSNQFNPKAQTKK